MHAAHPPDGGLGVWVAVGGATLAVWKSGRGGSPHSQWGTYSAISAVALAFVVILQPGATEHFNRFFGAVDPILVVPVAAVVGAVCLSALRSLGGLEVLRRGSTRRGIVVSIALASVLGVAIIAADFLIRYPEDTNVPVPQAFLFYPAVGFVAEVVFHLLPLTLVLLLLQPLRRRTSQDRLVWLSIIVVAITEPTFQVLFDGSALAWGDLYTWLHVFAIALLQLYVFWRYDFVSMYSFRLIYYAYWHIVWGVLRLRVLF